MAMPHRFPHVMKQHKSNKSPANLLIFDTETVDKTGFPKGGVSRQVLNFGYAYNIRFRNGQVLREAWHRFVTAESFYDFVWSCTEKDVPLYCFAHNLGFDLTILDFWLWARRKDFVVDYFVESDPPTFIVAKWKKRKVVFVDTLNYWRQSLKAIGESIGFEKLERPGPDATKAYWEKYGKRDVEVLTKALLNLIDYLHLNNLGQFGLSAASMAMSTFKHRFMKHAIFIHDNRHAMAAERQAYFGGLSDCFYVGRVPNKLLYKLDVNSMYPHVMLGRFPVKLLEYEQSPTIGRVRTLLQSMGIVAKVRINSKCGTYPVRYNGRLCYCKGNFDTFLCGPELKQAIYNGDIERIHVANIYAMEPIFKEYVNFFWEERQRYKSEGNNVAQYFVKIFMNSLYGKFGQLGYGSCVLTTERLAEIYKEHGKDFPDCYKDATKLFSAVMSETTWQPLGLGHHLTLRRLNNHVTVKVPNGEHNESFPAIAAYVTSYAREYLFKLIKTAGEREVYYVDTDSLITSERGYNALTARGYVDPKQLGKLKLEGTSRKAYFNAPKDYGFGDTIVQKGIRPNAIKLGANKYSQQQFEGIKSVLRRGGECFIDVKTITKSVSRKYNKGRKTASGWIEPFKLTLDSQTKKPEHPQLF